MVAVVRIILLYLLRVGQLQCSELVAYASHLMCRYLPLNTHTHTPIDIIIIGIFRVGGTAVENKTTFIIEYRESGKIKQEAVDG